MWSQLLIPNCVRRRTYICIVCMGRARFLTFFCGSPCENRDPLQRVLAKVGNLRLGQGHCSQVGWVHSFLGQIHSFWNRVIILGMGSRLNCCQYSEHKSGHARSRRAAIVKLKDGHQGDLLIRYCRCRMPEEGGEKMISCDTCQQWFHDKCVVIPPQTWTNEEFV